MTHPEILLTLKSSFQKIFLKNGILTILENIKSALEKDTPIFHIIDNENTGTLSTSIADFCRGRVFDLEGLPVFLIDFAKSTNDTLLIRFITQISELEIQLINIVQTQKEPTLEERQNLLITTALLLNTINSKDFILK